jgi:Ca-activated chloride channel family protein
VKRLILIGLGLLAGPLLAAIAAEAAPRPGSPPEDTPVFKGGVDLVALNVTVTDPKQKYVTGLGERDFAVYEDGVQQDLSFFAVSRVPLDLAILLDASASMGDKIALVQEAAVGFVHTLRPGDRGSVIQFQDKVEVLQQSTEDVASLTSAIQSTHARGATTLYNALYVALKEFARQAVASKEVRRQSIVVLSDGEDTASLISFEDVLDVAKRSGVSIFTISLKSKAAAQKIENDGHRYFSQADYAMKSLAQDTGGRTFFPLQLKELNDVYGSIAEELANQYSIGYMSKNPRHDGGFRRVVVRILSRPDVRSRTRLGYFAARASRVVLGGSSNQEP